MSDSEFEQSVSWVCNSYIHSKLRLKSDSISETQQIIFPTCLLQVLLSYLVSRLSGKSFIVHRLIIQVNATTVDLNFSTAMDRHVLNSKTTPQAARGCGIWRETNLLQGKTINMLFAGLGSVCTVKNLTLDLKMVAVPRSTSVTVFHDTEITDFPAGK